MTPHPSDTEYPGFVTGVGPFSHGRGIFLKGGSRGHMWVYVSVCEHVQVCASMCKCVRACAGAREGLNDVKRAGYIRSGRSEGHGIEEEVGGGADGGV